MGPTTPLTMTLLLKVRGRWTVKRISLSQLTIEQSNDGHMHGGLEENLGLKIELGTSNKHI